MAPPYTETDNIDVSRNGGVGNATISGPTYREKWGFYCVGFTGLWTLGASGWLLYYYLHHLSAIPTQGSSSIEAYKAALEANKLATDQLKESINFLFESMVTKTMIPIVTLLLGYLFGSSSKKE